MLKFYKIFHGAQADEELNHWISKHCNINELLSYKEIGFTVKGIDPYILIIYTSSDDKPITD